MTAQRGQQRKHAAVAGALITLALCTPVGARPAQAEAWLDTGDSGLRSDIQYLVDTGAIDVVLTTWPIPSADIAWAIEGIKEPEKLSSGQLAVLDRVKAYLARFRRDAFRITGHGSAAANPVMLRTFENTPREEGEVGGTLSDSGERFAGRLAVQLVYHPDDDQKVRLDGTYGSMRLGNWLLTAGALDRWWGPGWDGSLILSNNARPVPAIALDRESSAAFKSPWLSWIGPWRLTTFMGQMEQHREDISHPLLFGMRITARPFGNIHFGSVHPFRGFEFSLERTAQWCGEGLPCGWSAFWDMFTGKDNVGENVGAAQEPGNQMAGWSFRWASPFPGFPVAFYRQKTGEVTDEHSPLPRRTLDIYGLETWWTLKSGISWRVHAEYADTACFDGTSPTDERLYDCAYTNHIFDVEGYRYRGRVMGHSMDADGLGYTLGAQINTPGRVSGWLLLRYAELNRGGVVPDTLNTVAHEPVDEWELESGAVIRGQYGEFKVGLGFDQSTDQITEQQEQTLHAFLSYEHRF